MFTGPPETPNTGPVANAIGTYEITTFFRRGLAHLILGGVFERFPELRFVFTETNTSWVVEELQMMDYMCAMAKEVGSPLHPMMGPAAELLSKTPREYFGTNVWIGASISQRRDVANRAQLGTDRLIWGSDYPHHEGSFPHTRLAMRWNFWDVPEDEVRAMTSQNAAAAYGFDLDRLQQLADTIGPTPEEIATPLTADELPAASMCATIMDAMATLKPVAA